VAKELRTVSRDVYLLVGFFLFNIQIYARSHEKKNIGKEIRSDDGSSSTNTCNGKDGFLVFLKELLHGRVEAPRLRF